MRRLLTAAAIVLGIWACQAMSPVSASVMPAASAEQHYVLSQRALRRTAIGFRRAMAVTPLVQHKRAWLDGTVDAQVYWSCEQLWDDLYLTNQDGYQIDILYQFDMGQYGFDYEEWMLWGYIVSPGGGDPAPFYIFCLTPI